MKKFFTTLVLVILAGLILWCYFCLGTLTPATSEQLDETKIELKREIENLKIEIDSLKNGVNHVIDDVDTLKKGQVIIFNEVRKNNQSFWDFFD